MTSEIPLYAPFVQTKMAWFCFKLLLHRITRTHHRGRMHVPCFIFRWHSLRFTHICLPRGTRRNVSRRILVEELRYVLFLPIRLIRVVACLLRKGVDGIFGALWILWPGKAPMLAKEMSFLMLAMEIVLSAKSETPHSQKIPGQWLLRRARDEPNRAI